MNIYLGYAATGKVSYESRIIQALNKEAARHKLSNYYKEKFPEIYKSPLFTVVINDTIK